VEASHKYGMTRKLEKLFDLPDAQDDVNELPTTPTDILALDDAIDKIDAALPAVRGLESTDQEMDELADLAKSSYSDLMDLGMQVDSRFASEIFGVASTMLGHAITAKTAKLDKKLRMIDLQMKKARLDQQNTDAPATQTGTGMVLSRNDLLQKIIDGTRQKPQSE
jgi:hypothetical protein